ncbi:MAG: OmpH family outer membrane protein [bacterium]|nr:OmpH family outer membrane protein [bacterium]
MKKIIGVLTILGLVCMLPYKINAAQVVKVGFVDIQKTLEECDVGKKAKEDLQGVVEKKQIDIDKLSAEIESLQKALEEQVMLSAEKKKEKENVINEKMEVYQRMALSAKKEISKKESEVTEPLIKKIRDIIDKIGKEKGYSLILEKNYSSVLYGSPEIDITSQVIKELNEQK